MTTLPIIARFLTFQRLRTSVDHRRVFCEFAGALGDLIAPHAPRDDRRAPSHPVVRIP